MILSTHGLIASSILQVDADWLAYYNRVIAAGGSLTTTEQNATKTLVADLKSYGIWSSMKAIYPMVGASAAACAQNLRSASFTGTFTSGWTFASTGVTPNGTSAYMDTGFNLINDFASPSNASIGAYLRSNTGVNRADMGAGDTAGASRGMIMFVDFSNIYYASAFSALLNGGTNTDSRGFYLVQRNGGNAENRKRGNISIDNIQALSTGIVENLNIYVGAASFITGSATQSFSDRETAFNFIGTALTTTEYNNYYTAVQAFQTTLSRNV
jgi:hypothetical protein